MIVVLKPHITPAEERAVLREIKKLGYRPHVMRGVARTVIGAIGDERKHQSLETLSVWPQVESVMPVQKRYKLVSREAHPANSVIHVGNLAALTPGKPGQDVSRSRSRAAAHRQPGGHRGSRLVPPAPGRR